MNAQSKLVAVNERGLRIGEDHHRARLNDAQDDELRDLLDVRTEFMAAHKADKIPPFGDHWRVFSKQLAEAGLRYEDFAVRFSISVRTVRDIEACTIRAQVADRWKRVKA